MEYFFNGLGVFFGVFAGAVAGTFITLFVNKFQSDTQQKYMIDTFKYELEYDARLIDEFLSVLEEYYTKVIEGYESFQRFNGYMRFSKIASATA